MQEAAREIDGTLVSAGTREMSYFVAHRILDVRCGDE